MIVSGHILDYHAKHLKQHLLKINYSKMLKSLGEVLFNL